MRLQIDHDQIARFCRERGISRLELFGSSLREDFREDSDVDLLCTMRPEIQQGLFEWVALKFDLERLIGRKVDLVSRLGVERSKNPYRRLEILNSTRPIYVEG